jgi:hypothetical protein
MKYHIKNKINKKELKKSRMKPIPLMDMIPAMRNSDELTRFEPRRGNISKNNINSKTVPSAKDDG